MICVRCGEILFFYFVVDWFPALNKAGRKRVDHEITEPLAPLLVERCVCVCVCVLLTSKNLIKTVIFSDWRFLSFNCTPLI